MIFEIPIVLIDKETGEPIDVTAVIDTVSRETLHRPSHHPTETVLVEEEPDG